MTDTVHHFSYQTWEYLDVFQSLKKFSLLPEPLVSLCSAYTTDMPITIIHRELFRKLDASVRDVVIWKSGFTQGCFKHGASFASAEICFESSFVTLRSWNRMPPPRGSEWDEDSIWDAEDSAFHRDQYFAEAQDLRWPVEVITKTSCPNRFMWLEDVDKNFVPVLERVQLRYPRLELEVIRKILAYCSIAKHPVLLWIAGIGCRGQEAYSLSFTSLQSISDELFAVERALVRAGFSQQKDITEY